MARPARTAEHESPADRSAQQKLSACSEQIAHKAAETWPLSSFPGQQRRVVVVGSA